MKNNITLIDELPDLEDLENKSSILNREQSDKVKKFIRSTNKNSTPYEAGMKSPPTYNPNGPYPIGNMNYQNNNPHIQQHYQYNQNPYPPQQNYPYNNAIYYDQNYIGDDSYIIPHSSGGLAPNSQMFYEPYNAPKQRVLSCAEVADHSSTCSVCSKLYNNDKTIYIVIIVILMVICLFMLKKILNL
jgi:hypothetical protein